ncbi:MAG: AAA family ATPase, partial [Pseudomonadota bacterium]
MSALRIASLNCAPFGRFDNESFAFPERSGAPDFHIVVGDNEAGKTTLKNAILSVLFAPPRTAPFLWRSGSTVSAQLLIDGEEIEASRTGTARQVKPSGAQEALAAALTAAGMTRDAFLARQAFSHADMRDHAEALKASDGEISGLLMRDAGGLERADDLVRTARKEADELFKRDGRSKSELRTKLQERGTLVAAFEAAEQRADAFTELERTLASAEAEFDLAEKRLVAAAEAVRTVSDEIKATRTVRRLCEIDAEIGGETAALAPKASDRVAAAMVEEAAALALKKAAGERRERHEEARSALIVDEGVLSGADEIDALEERRQTFQALKADREERIAAATDAEAEALIRSQRLGFAADDAEALAGTLPAASFLKAAQVHLSRKADIVRVAETASAAVKAAREAPEPAKPLPPDDTLMSALAAARALGDVDARVEELRARIKTAERAVEAAARAAGAEIPAEGAAPVEEGRAA